MKYRQPQDYAGQGDCAMPLTDVFLRGVKASGTPQKYADSGGLYLFVSPAGGKLWRMDYRFTGKRKTMIRRVSCRQPQGCPTKAR